MRNLMSRDEYLQKANEGFIKDTIKKGWEKAKSFFKIGMKKIKDFITIFDSEGHVFPVVSLQAVIDRFSKSNVIKVFASKEISKNVVDAGGEGCSDVAKLKEDDEMYGDVNPDSVEYRNYLTLGRMLTENQVSEGVVTEGWKGVENDPEARTSYSKDDAFGDTIPTINYDEFEERIDDLVFDRITSGGKVVRSDGVRYSAEGNMLIFGAPGIGKSTIPNTVIEKYNKTVAKGDPSKMISIITVDCGNLHSGDFIMPTMPKEMDIMGDIKRNREAFPTANNYLESIDDENQKRIKDIINGSSQFRSTDAPKSWLPSYQEVGDDDVNKILDDNANGGVFVDENGKSVKTGNGGIILFDELLRADEDVFKELMNFLLFRRFNKWVLGSKWVVIACSNRPSDDDEVNKVWGHWSGSPAKKGRFTRMFQLVPDPESWKKWAKDHGCDDLILDFIFDKNSKRGNEYPRWHTHVKNGSGDIELTLPIDPRQWGKAINAINKRIIRQDYPNILKMTEKDFQYALKGIFDPEFIEDIIIWFNDHKDKVDLDMIMNDPTYLTLKDEVINDPEKARSLINNLTTSMVERFKDAPEKLTDEKLANIIIWMARNFKNDIRITNDFVEDIVTSILKDKSKFAIINYIKTMMMVEAAFPCNNYVNSKGVRETFEETINGYINRSIKPWPKDSMEIVKGYMKEFFPWRISGDTIKYYDDVKKRKQKNED